MAKERVCTCSIDHLKMRYVPCDVCISKWYEAKSENLERKVSRMEEHLEGLNKMIDMLCNELSVVIYELSEDKAWIDQESPMRIRSRIQEAVESEMYDKKKENKNGMV